MTTEEVIKKLEHYRYCLKFQYGWYNKDDDEALDMAIKALKQTDGDLISRKDTIEWLKKVTVTDGITFETGFKQILTDIKQMPSAENTAEWIIHPKTIYAHLVCNKCLSNAPYDCKTNYCPNCGARMRGEP